MLDKASRPITCFTVPVKDTCYQWTVTPMGLQGSPASFARLINYVFRGLKGMITYIDDVLTHSKGHGQQLMTLERALLRLCKCSLKLNPSKSLFGAAFVHYLGDSISGKGIQPGDKNLQAIQDFSEPDTPKIIREFVGLMNYLGFLQPVFAAHSVRLTDLFKKDNEYKACPLPPADKETFLQLQRGLACAPW